MELAGTISEGVVRFDEPCAVPDGTKVKVRIPENGAVAPVGNPEELALAAARGRMRELFARATGFRNAPRLLRGELYERGSLR